MLQEFDLEIRDKKGVENLVVDHLSRFPEEVQDENSGEIQKTFLDEKLLLITTGVTPWYVDIVYYLVSRYVPPKFSSQQRKRFFRMTRN